MINQFVTCREFSLFTTEDIDLVAASAEEHISLTTKFDLRGAWYSREAKLCPSLNMTPSFHSRNTDEEETDESAYVTLDTLLTLLAEWGMIQVNVFGETGRDILQPVVDRGWSTVTKFRATRFGPITIKDYITHEK